MTVLEVSGVDTAKCTVFMDLILKCTWDEDLKAYPPAGLDTAPRDKGGKVHFKDLSKDAFFPDVIVMNKASGC